MNNLEATEEIRASHECVPFFDYKTKTIFFTICSWNSLAYAITLWKSLTKFNGPVTFYAAICDAADGFDYLSLPFPVVLIEKLGIPSLDSMADRYNITELSRAIKPFVFTYLFEKHSDSVVVYMDPDILVTSRLEELRKLLAEGADCVLTPHILEPNEFAAFNEKQMLVYGIYNLGFCALRATPKVRRIVSWWGRMLEKDCVIGPSNRLFVDQKWADLLPAFVERTSILHHCGYNVAYWNLAQRRVRQTEKGWVVDNQPLRFLHFSGNRISDSVLFSRHSQDWALNFGDTPLLFEEYVNCVKSNGHDYYRQIPYGFNLNGEAGVNLEATESEQSEPLSSCNLRGLGSQQTDGLLPPIQLLRVSSFSSFQEIKNQMSETFLERTQCEIDSIPSDESVFYLPGFCVVCGKMSSFQVSYTYSTQKLPNGHQIPNWREHLNCTHCGFVNRMRAFFHIFFQEGTPSIDDCIYITEQSTAAYRWLARFFPNLTGSE
ncbi:MAG: hypothetical protein GXX84_20590, partial [Acidobacteria bacterium]|nr:hypothetical protein [Acidobacteriota bacterium]